LNIKWPASQRLSEMHRSTLCIYVTSVCDSAHCNGCVYATVLYAQQH